MAQTSLFSDLPKPKKQSTPAPAPKVDPVEEVIPLPEPPPMPAARPAYTGYVRGYFRRTKNLFDPNSKVPFRMSRSKIELFMRCQRCFYLDLKLGIKQPDSFPLTLNTAVDALLKKEFDIYRASKTPHPIMKKNKLDAIPFTHAELDDWRENFVGVQALHSKTNFLITGAVDDVWVTPQDELIVVDYKATAKDSEVNIDAEWQDSYKRQMEIYQWLLRQKGFKVSSTGYFVYVNGKKDTPRFDENLSFTTTLIGYVGNDNWIEPTLFKARECLSQTTLPPSASDCDYCGYRKAAATVEKL
jgi:hypothetical protein